MNLFRWIPPAPPTCGPPWELAPPCPGCGVPLAAVHRRGCSRRRLELEARVARALQADPDGGLEGAVGVLLRFIVEGGRPTLWRELQDQGVTFEEFRAAVARTLQALASAESRTL